MSVLLSCRCLYCVVVVVVELLLSCYCCCRVVLLLCCTRGRFFFLWIKRQHNCQMHEFVWLAVDHRIAAPLQLNHDGVQKHEHTITNTSHEQNQQANNQTTTTTKPQSQNDTTTAAAAAHNRTSVRRNKNEPGPLSNKNCTASCRDTNSGSKRRPLSLAFHVVVLVCAVVDVGVMCIAVAVDDVVADAVEEMSFFSSLPLLLPVPVPAAEPANCAHAAVKSLSSWQTDSISDLKTAHTTH